METPLDLNKTANFTLSVQDLERIALGLAPGDPEAPVPKLDLSDLAKTLENIESPLFNCPRPQPAEQHPPETKTELPNDEPLGNLGFVLFAAVVGSAFLGPLMDWISE